MIYQEVQSTYVTHWCTLLFAYTLFNNIISYTLDQNSRHSSILLGDTNTAKSVSWKMLAATLTRLHREKVPGFEVVHPFPINPKALTLGELYGEYNLATGEWKDGVLSSIMRTTCQGRKIFQHNLSK